MCAATNEREIAEAQRKGLDALRALPQHRPARPLRVGIVGEYFTAPTQPATLIWSASSWTWAWNCTER